MSYAICHFDKFNRAAVKGIEIHNQRELDGVSHTNPDIDWERSQLNYDLHNANPVNYLQTIKNRIAQLNLKRKPRTDAVLMAGYVVTSDQAFFDLLSVEQQRQFFQDSYDFLADRYGRENVITAMVHLDEKTPHMHFSIVPVTADGRLSAKSIFTKRELSSLHTDFHREIGQKWGLSRGEIGSKEKHIETAKLKRQTLQNEITELENQKQQLQQHLIDQENHSKKEKTDLAALDIRGKQLPLNAGVIVSTETLENMKSAAAENIKLRHENDMLIAALQHEKNNNKMLHDSIEKYKNNHFIKSLKQTFSEFKTEAIQEIKRLKNLVDEWKHKYHQMQHEYHQTMKKMLWAEKILKLGCNEKLKTVYQRGLTDTKFMDDYRTPAENQNLMKIQAEIQNRYGRRLNDDQGIDI